MKIKIIHIVQCAGGVDKYLQMFFKHIDRDKFENILICSHDYNALDYHGIVHGIEFVEMINSINTIKDLSAMISIRRLITNYRPDIVYCHSSKAGVLGRIASFGLKIPVLYNAHGWSFNMNVSNLRRKVYRQIEKLLSSITYKIITISHHEKETALKSEICDESKVHTIINGVDLHEIFKYRNYIKPNFRETLNIPKEAFVIGMVGRLSEQKAPDVFVQMAIEIKKKYENSYFIIVGDGVLKKDILNLIESSNLQSSFMITGWIDTVYDYMSTFDVGVLLSRWEGFGLVLAEYMAFQIPIVATNVDAIPELITENFNGFTVPKDDYYQAAIKTLKYIGDEGLRKMMSDNGLSVVKEKFDIKRLVNEHEILFQKVMKA